MRRPPVLPAALPVLAFLSVLVLTACGDSGPPRATLSVAEAMAGDTAGFARADTSRTFAFPADHGPHPEFRTEWWYFTGNLSTPGGRDFGYQLTLFRNALGPEETDVDSRWATRQAWMGHFALTDVEGERFHAFERLERGALGLAGTSEDPVRAYVGDWEVVMPLTGDSGATFRVRAARESVGIELRLTALKPRVLQGDEGLSQKGPEPGNASYYYSFTRLAAEGTVTVDGTAHPVRGLSWLDREWSTSALSAGVVGWDWFALQLDDGSELMVYRLRGDDGGTAPFSAGSYVRPAGSTVRLDAEGFGLTELDTWMSPAGDTYPSGWRVEVPELDLRLTVEPRLENQELDLAFRYWEGAVSVEGRVAGEGVRGRGYVELTGYADGPLR